jgi:hypothetical protein
MSVQDDFFLPRNLDEDSILNQGVEGAAGDPQVIGGSSLASGHQGSSVESRWNLGSLDQPPPNIKHVPSHVSVATHVTAATSVVATSGYFVDATCRSVAEIDARQVICPKSACRVLGSRDYTLHQEAAAKALPHVFASAKHFHAKNADRESSNKYANLQSEYAGNLAKIKNCKHHMDAWDMIDHFAIPTLIDPDAISVEDGWAERNLTGEELGEACPLTMLHMAARFF